MKVLWITGAFYPEVRQGGAVTQSWEECRALASAGVDVTVYTTRLSGETRHTDDVELGSLHVRYFAQTLGYWRPFSLEYSRAALLAPRGFDLLHLNIPWQLANPFAALAARLSRTPYVVSLRGTMLPWAFRHHALWKRPYFAVVEGQVISGSSAIIASNERERAIAMARWPRIPAYSPFPVVDVARYAQQSGRAIRRRFGIAADAPLSLFVGRNHPVKGLDLLLHAFTTVRRIVPAARLLIVGPEHGGTNADLMRLATSLNISDAIVIAGMLDEDDKVAAYHEADLVVMPSRQEGFGQVAAEAMAAGRPVVVTTETGIAPAVVRANAGLVVAVEAQAIADAIVRLSSDLSAARRLGESAADFARRHFSSASVAGDMLKIYETSLAVA